MSPKYGIYVTGKVAAQCTVQTRDKQRFFVKGTQMYMNISRGGSMFPWCPPTPMDVGVIVGGTAITFLLRSSIVIQLVWHLELIIVDKYNSVCCSRYCVVYRTSTPPAESSAGEATLVLLLVT